MLITHGRYLRDKFYANLDKSNKRYRSEIILHALKRTNEELIKCRLNEPVVNYRNRRLLFPIVAYLAGDRPGRIDAKRKFTRAL